MKRSRKQVDFRKHLSTTDAEGKRVRLFPASVKGRFQKIRNWVQPSLVFIFLLLPWLEINGFPVLQLDIIHRRFYLAGHLFLAQDVPGVIFVFCSFLFAAALVTAVWGRAWCGWACPQTVFIEVFFRRIERWIEGDHVAQKALVNAPWSLEKVTKKTLKWSAFIIFSLLLAHSFLAYFVGPQRIGEMIQSSPFENPGSFAVVFTSTLIILFDFAWFREQFCIVLCPYGRMQALMMDNDSLSVAYDYNRGEPRRGLLETLKSQGDCIDCYRCVQVCPTGIDIRNGQQMECIACTACIDACDTIMSKVNKAPGLIRYESQNVLEGKKTKAFRPRVLIYSLLFGVSLFGLVAWVSQQELYQTEILRAANTPYQLLQSETGQELVLNQYNVRWYNLSSEKARVEVQLSESAQSRDVELIQPQQDFELATADKKEHVFFLKFPRSLLNQVGTDSAFVDIHWQGQDGHQIKQMEVKLVGPRTEL